MNRSSFFAHAQHPLLIIVLAVAMLTVAPAPSSASHPDPTHDHSTHEHGGVEGMSLLMVGGAVVLLLGGIGVVIARDARQHTPGNVRGRVPDGPRPIWGNPDDASASGSARPATQRVQARRGQNKRARQARKRNR